MSKVDAQRALRDARFAAYREKVAAAAAAPAAPAAGAAGAAKAAQTADPKVSVRPEAGAEQVLVLEAAPAPVSDLSVTVTEPADQPDPAGAELCGHRNMGGKSCLRPAGHAEKSHRYK